MGSGANTIKQDINRGAGITLLSNVFKLAEFFLTLLAARLFGVGVWGQYIFLNAFFTPVLRLSGAGMDKGVVWFIASHQDQRIMHSFFRKLGRRMVAFSVVLLLGISAYQLLTPGHAKDTSALIEPVSLLLMGLSVPFMVLTNLNLGVCIAFKKVEHDILVRSIIYPALQLALPCLLAIWSRETRVLAAAYLAGSIVGYWMSQYLAHPLKKRLAQNPAADTTEADTTLKTLWNYSWPMGLRDVVLSVQQRVDIWCLALFLPPESLGVYGLALSIANSVKTVRQSFDNILLAVISQLKRSTHGLEIKKAYLHAGELIIALQMPIFAFLVFFAPSVLKLSGKAYAQGEPVLVIFALTLILNSYLGLSGMVVMGLGKTRWALSNDLVGLGLVVLLNLLLVPHFGIVGAAFATSSSILCVSLIWFYEAAYLIKRIPLNLPVVINFLGGVILVAISYFTWKHIGHDAIASRALYFGGFALAYGILLGIKFRKSFPTTARSA